MTSVDCVDEEREKELVELGDRSDKGTKKELCPCILVQLEVIMTKIGSEEGIECDRGREKLLH